MKTMLVHKEILSFDEIKDYISGHICRLLDNVHMYDGREVIRFEVSCPKINCFLWLGKQLDNDKVYWADRDGGFEVAGAGVADLLVPEGSLSCRKLFNSMRQKLSSEDKHLRYYGGMSFDPKKSGSEWQEFGEYRFVIPRFEVVNAEGQSFFAVNIAKNDINLQSIKQCIGDLEKICFLEIDAKSYIPEICSVEKIPNESQWNDTFKENIQLSLGKMYEKIVLARKTSISFKAEPDPVSIFTMLQKKTQGCFHYYFQGSDNAIFLGASPERLFKRDGVYIESEALAGTKPRGKTEDEDAVNRKELLGSLKEAVEHGFVSDKINNVLNSFCSVLDRESKCSILEVPTAYHLITRFAGELNKDINDGTILSKLHPTPAVGGVPTDKAIQAISVLEPFSRGWYAGPVGFVGYDSADFAVALRCALIEGKIVNLYAGAGIVEGSTAEGEWREIEDKNSVFMRIFEEDSE